MVQGPGWVPGAFKLVYTSYLSQFPAIYLQDLATGSRRIVTEYPGANFSPAVSPDGRKVAMILSKSGQVDLYVANIDGSGLRQLTHNQEDESSPCWSPDSLTSCFGGRDFGGRATWFAMSADGGEPRRITHRERVEHHRARLVARRQLDRVHLVAWGHSIFAWSRPRAATRNCWSRARIPRGRPIRAT